MGLLRRIRSYVFKKWDMVTKYYRESLLFKYVVTSLISTILNTAGPLVPAYLAVLIHSSPAAPAVTGSYVTHLGEHRCEKLPDSSEVCLNTSTEVRFAYNGRTRYVRLVTGEAYFVVHNDRRPFEVLSGGVLVHDISTAFDIYRKRGSTLVTVVQGRVRVVGPVNIDSQNKFELGEPDSAWRTAPELRKFQRIEFDEATRTLQPRPTLNDSGASQLLAWQDGRIDLTDRPLSEALAEFSRYQPISQFRYSESLGRLRVGGDLGFSDLDDFLDSLEKGSVGGLHIYHSKTGTGEHTVVYLSRHPEKPPRIR